MCLTVLIWLIKTAAFVWVSGGIHLQLVPSLGCWEEVQSRKTLK